MLPNSKSFYPPRLISNHFDLSPQPPSLLHVGGKESVVLYVGRGNPAAHVYGRVGFVGLDSDLGGSRDIESWKELGFERSVIRLGFW